MTASTYYMQSKGRRWVQVLRNARHIRVRIKRSANMQACTRVRIYHAHTHIMPSSSSSSPFPRSAHIRNCAGSICNCAYRVQTSVIKHCTVQTKPYDGFCRPSTNVFYPEMLQQIMHVPRYRVPCCKVAMQTNTRQTYPPS
jgi:hypothetical protein